MRLAPHVKAHLSVILALAMVAKAGDYMIQTWSLDYSTRGAVFGASYTDVHASLPVLHFLAIVSLVAAVIFLANIRYRGWRLPAIAIAVMFLTWVLAGKVYPAIVQQYKVSPNEITAESPYIANNIEATRYAFGLDNITSVPDAAADDLTAADVKANQPTLESVRLWEPRPALDTYQQIQEIRLYYSFTDVDVDRYVVDGHFRQVLISARELDQNQLQQQSQTWVNKHLTYTHGYGFVMSPVNEAGGDGLPLLWVKRHPPAHRYRPQDHPAGDLLRGTRQRLRGRQDHQRRVRLSQGRHERLLHLRGAGRRPDQEQDPAAGVQLPLQDREDPLLRTRSPTSRGSCTSARCAKGSRLWRPSSTTTRTPIWCCATTGLSSGCGTPTPRRTASPTRSRTATPPTTSATR